MIYLKTLLWLLGYPIILILSCALFVISYIRGCEDCLDWCIKLIEWHIDIKPKED